MDAMDFNIRGINYYGNDDGCWQNDIVDVVTRNITLESNKFLINDIDPLLSSSEEEEKLVKSDPEFNNLDAWMTKSVEEWSPRDVLSWISSEAQYFGVMIHEMHGHNFFGIDGYKLKHMSEDDFTTLSSGFGPSLFNRFQDLILSKDRAFDQSTPIVPQSTCDDLWTQKFENNNEHDQFLIRNIYEENSLNGNRVKNVFVPDMDNSSDSGIETELPTTTPIIKRKPGRPKGSRRKKKPEKLGRLWEFIRDLLLNADYCPSLICWDNYEEGMFRFVHSDKVAKLWGSKKDNPEMNYEKLSRAMRYYYKSRVLLPVYGRRLVYKFGPTATGWRTSNPNFRRRG